MSLTTIYTKNNIQGDMVLIGNTLGLAKASGALTPGTLGSIGAFLTTVPTSVAPGGWGGNTTLNWQQNSSQADLAMPANSSVIKSYLFWSADYINGAINLTTSVPNAVTLVDPSGISHAILPDSSTTGITNIAEGGEAATYYQNFTDVTTIVQNGGNGTWVCGGVPCALNAASDDLNYAGWALQVVYTNPSFKLTNIVIQAGPNLALDPPVSATINYGGPPLSLYATIGYAEGDAILSGDVFTIAGITTSGSNNPGNNIFCSQINYPGQTINTSGPYGTVNANPSTATNVTGCRQGWDVMKVPVNLPSAAATANTDIATNSDPGFIYTLGFVSQASQPAISMTKSVNKTTAQTGDTLTYTIVIKNAVQAASNFIFYDTMPVGASFIPSSFALNGVTLPSADPTSGVSLGTIPVGGTDTITFNVTATPPYTDSRNIINFSTGNYSYTGVTLNALSNNVVTTLTNLGPITKTVSQAYGTIGDILTYSFLFNNYTNDTFTNIVFVDTTPNGTSFIPNSVYVNAINQPGYLPDPPGITIPDVGPQGSVTLSYNVLVTTLPTINPIPNQGLITYNDNGTIVNTFSNIVTTQINNSSISSTKIVNKAYANVGDILTYTIPVTNTGNVTALTLLLTDTIPNGTSYISGTLIQDGNTVIGVTSLITATLPLNIPANKTSTISFKVQINTIPSPNPIPNIANIGSTYLIDNSTVPNRYGSSNTDTNYAYTQVNTVSMGNILKSVDKAYSTCGDTLTYTITLPNSGNTTAFNVVLKDTLPAGTSFIANSVIINGIGQPGQNPSTGINIGTIPAGNTAVVKFCVLVNC